MAIQSLADAFYNELRDVLSAEKQLMKALPKMAKAASSEELKRALENHLEETEEQVNRVESAFAETERAVRAKTCEGMKGLIEEADHVLKEESDPAVKDAMIIACAQKVEHYEIATYGTLCTWAEILGYNDALQLLKQNIEEEEAADQLLTELSETINRAAMSM